MDLPATDLRYDPVSGLIWASVERLGPMAETVTSIDPRTGAIGDAVFLGDHPGAIAVSDDGRFVYVALDDAATIVRLRADDLSEELTFVVGTDRILGTRYAAQIEVLPGEPGSVAVSMRFNPRISPPFAGVAVFDDGVPRERVIGRSPPANVIAFGATAAILYGYNRQNTGADFATFSIDERGIELESLKDSFGFAPFPRFMFDMKHDAGLIFGTSGHLYDPRGMRVLGRYAFDTACDQPRCGCVVPDAATGTVYFLTSDTRPPGDTVLKVFDLETFEQIETHPLPGIRFDDIYADVCLRWGEKGFAFEATERLPQGRTDYVVLVDLP